MKIIFRALVVILLGLSVKRADAETLRLALNWKAEPQFGGFYEAERLGLFEKLKKPLQILQGGSGTPTLQMLLSGQAEYAVVSADEIVISAGRGNEEIIALFASFQNNPQAIMLHAENPAKDLEAALKSPGTLLWQEGLPYAQYLKKKWGPLKVNTAPYQGGISHFQHDKKILQQCFITSEPLMAKKSQIPIKTFLVADSGYNPYTTVLATRRDRLKKFPTEVTEMVRAVRGGWESYLRSPSSAHQAILKLNPAMDQEALTKGAEVQRILIHPDSQSKLGQMSLIRWQQLVTQLLDLGVINKTIDAKNLFLNIE